MSDPNFDWLREVGGVFKFGSGVLGKSAIAVGILLLVGGVAIWKLHSDNAILTALGAVASVFLLWFFSVMYFVWKNPASGLLEGAEWSAFERFQAGAKGYLPPPSEQEPIAPGSKPPSPLNPEDLLPPPDKEPGK